MTTAIIKSKRCQLVFPSSFEATPPLCTTIEVEIVDEVEVGKED